MYRALKIRAAETGQTVSGIMNEAIRAQLSEDLDDLNIIEARMAEAEKSLSYDEALKELQASGII